MSYAPVQHAGRRVSATQRRKEVVCGRGLGGMMGTIRVEPPAPASALHVSPGSR